MDRQSEMIKMLQNTFDIDGTFYFRCTACGKCCRNREDVMLSPYDINRMAKHLGIPAGQVVRDYCIWYPGHQSRLPVVVMRMDGPEKTCPFLKNLKCSIHSAKPAACALFPLGRAGMEDGIRYFLQDVSCGAKDRGQTVREWLAGCGLEESEAWFMEWQEAVIPLAGRVRQILGHFSEKMADTVEMALLNILYARYLPDKDFMGQFRDNVAKANEMLTMLEAAAGQMGNS